MLEFELLNPSARRRDRFKMGATRTWPFLMGVLFLVLQGCATAPALSNGEATQNQAKAAYLVCDYQRTLAIIMPLADAGEPWAQYTLGYMYYYGHGVHQDRQTAKQWIRNAAEKGYPPAVQAMQRISVPPPTTEEENAEPTQPAPFNATEQAAPSNPPDNKDQTPTEAAPPLAPVTPSPTVEKPAPQAPPLGQPLSPPAQETAPAVPPGPVPPEAPPSTTVTPQSSSQEDTITAIDEPGHTAKPPPSSAASMPPQTTAAPSSSQAEKEIDHTPPAQPLDKGIKGRDWISNQDPQHFTAQLISSGDEAAVIRFIREHHLEKQAAYYSTSQSGKTWYSVVYGSFQNHNAARHALSQLPHALRRDAPRIRNFQDIQTQLDSAP